MANSTLTWQTLWLTIVINVVLAAIYVVAYSIASVQRINARVFFCRWFVKDEEDAKKRYEGLGISLNPLHYLHAFNWMWASWRMDEQELIDHAGLDMAMYLRMFIMAWKIFFPITVVSCAVLLPIYITQTPAGGSFAPSTVDQLSIANLPMSTQLTWIPCVLAYIFNFWILWVMSFEFKRTARMRTEYVAKQQDHPNQFSVLVRQIPAEHSSAAPEEADKFFQEMHPFTYLSTQACYDAKDLPKLEPKVAYRRNRLEAAKIRAEKKGVRPTTSKVFCGPKVDAIELHEEEVAKLEDEIQTKQEKILTDPKAIIPACFVSFSSRRGAAVAAQTLQCSNPSQWVTTWAPEPEDVVWTNLSIPYLQLGIRKMVVAFIVFIIVVGFTIPVGIVQGFASLSTLEQYAPWLNPVLDIPVVKAFLEGFIPGFALSVFLMILPPILLGLSKSEGYVAQSEIDRAAAGKHFYFKVVTVFLTNVLVGSAMQQMKQMVENPTDIPQMLGNAIPTKASFFITFTLVNGWCGLAAELLRLTPLIIFHIKNMLLVVTPEDRIKAMSPPNPGYFGLIPEMEMYFLFCFMYMVLAPFYLPFAMVFFVWGYLVMRNQFINVYSPAYDLKGGYWPHFHARAISALVMSQLILIVVLALKQNIGPPIALLPLPVITLLINFHLLYDRYGAVFKKVPLDEATRRDKEDAKNPDWSPSTFLEGAYLHPALKSLGTKDMEGGKGNQEASQLLDRPEAEGVDDPIKAVAPEPLG